MPIKGMTDRESITGRYPIIGKLRKGSEKQKKNGKEIFGKDLDHFRFTSKREDIVEAFVNSEFGETPRQLKVHLPYATVEECFSTWKEKWTAARLDHRCDGEMTTILRLDDGTYSHDPAPCPGGCNQVGRLSVILMPLIHAGFFGTVTMETHSKHDCINITRVLYQAEQDARRFGRDLTGAEFLLYREQHEVATPDGPRRKKWLVRLEPSVDWARRMLQAAQQEAMLLLPNGSTVPSNDFVSEVAEVEVIEPESEPAAPRQGDFLSSKDQFWSDIYGLGLEQDDGREFLERADGDFEKALELLRNEFPA
jgi:hypothetical protein